MNAPLPEIPTPTRRDALKKALAMLVGGLVATLPALAGLAVYFDPVRRMLLGNGKASAAAAGYIDVAPLTALPPDGTPRRFQVIAERVDAWTKHPPAPIGAVFLKRPKDAPTKIIAFNVVCPHAGCSVEIVPPAPATQGAAHTVGQSGQGGFRCPCHNSTFHPDGSRAPGCVSPRGLDELEVDEAGLAEGVIRVRFQNFTAGVREKTPVG